VENNRPEGTFQVTMLPGDGVGPELMQAVKEVFKAASVPVVFDEHHLSEVQNMASEEKLDQVVDSMKASKVALIGKIHTPMEYKGELASYDMRLRRKLDLFANVVHVKSLPGYKTRHNNLDLVIIREQTEGEYSSLEHESAKGVIECLKIITRTKSQRIAKFAFDFATKKGRSKVTAVHKANIMKLGDGLFLQCCKEVAELYPKIKFDTMIIDNCCMQLVQNPYQFDVLVMPNLYGNIIDNLAAGLVGGAGVVPGESYSAEYAVFEMVRGYTPPRAAEPCQPPRLLGSAKGVIECLKIITRTKSQRIAKFAFDFATKKGRSKVTAVHKANIMKLGDGLFLQCCKEVAELYPKIKFDTMIIDNCCMQLVQNPYQFDVLVMPNLYGNIIDNLAAGLVGGAGVVPGESYSAEYAVFEMVRTADMGGYATSQEFTQAVINALDA
ncbi:PREDICTED: isocitrate dehydrogenase [NAD] subunit beta, mitochondrial-like, partial [Chaetura pelagica]